MAAARLYVIDQVNGAQVERISGEPIKSVRRHTDDLTLLDAIGNIRNQAHVRSVRIDFYNFRRQYRIPQLNMLEPMNGGGEFGLHKTPAQRPHKRLRINQLAQKT